MTKAMLCDRRACCRRHARRPSAFRSGIVRVEEDRYDVGVKGVPGTLQDGGVGFASTHWTVVLHAAHHESSKVAEDALTVFCQEYWPPLYTFLRRRGYPSSDAQDLVQGFFAHLFQHNSLSRADQRKGRLRTFLLGALNHYLANEHDRARTLKRGGSISFLSLHEHMAESEKTPAANNGLGSIDSYDQSWATTMVSRAWEHVQQSLVSEEQARWFEELKPFLFGGATPPRPREVAARLNVSVDTLRSALRRLRERLRESLRVEVARTVSNPAEVEEELRYLLQMLLA